METARLRQRGVRLQAIGRRDRLPTTALCAIEKAEAATAAGRGLHLRVAIDYSSRDAIVRAATSSLARNPLLPRHLLLPALSQALTAECGDVDLLIRTGGEMRLSDFLLWESAYAELIFTHRMWPEFDKSDLDVALAEFSRRDRRFGGTVCAAQASP
jgi:undecaprenyl diphosphate synthase